MKTKSRWNERRRLLLLELAVVLPAAALIGFSIAHLKSIQRDRAVEATFQRDFQQMLAIFEKKIAGRVYDMVDSARADFPRPGQAVQPMLDNVLAKSPWAAHAFLYDKENGFVFRSQPGRMQDPDFHAESDMLGNDLRAELPLEDKEMVQKLWAMDKKEVRTYMAYAEDVQRGSRKGYVAILLFPIRGVPENRLTIAGLVFDAEFLRNTFLPQMLDELLRTYCTAGQREPGQYQAALMIHERRESQPLAASTGWSGEPEVERNLDSGLPYLTLGIKYQGTTIAALSQHFLRTSYLILLALSLFMAGGIYLTYRSVNREVALARLKSDFVSNVSHELRTPLSLIRLYAETLEMGRLSQPEKYQEYYQIIRKESERLTALINNILDFSRIEAGKKEYEFRETNVGELVRNTLESYRYQIEQGGFAFQQEIQDDLPTVQVDREAIARSLLNLVNNAVKYSTENKFLGVNVYRTNGSVRLEVIDHGIGIPAGEQDKVFEKFYRACDPLVHNTKGSGLGLTLVRHVVLAHGGEVSVESAPGRGSKFTIVLPLQSGMQAAGAGVA
ncbi:MAG: HAMP domain-containing sensor histidine kinase [Terriglobales bacterium]